ncbi:MAG: hypothetical protein R3270_05600 [Gammaproteobacteria bacterium]|nr:hypothetical protein [Gammaproteobacteria bacterium]
MWLRPDIAKAMLLVGLVLSVVAMGGEEATRYVVETTTPIERTADDGAGMVTRLDVDSNCVR